MVFVMHTAFCSNRLLHKYFVESTASPSRCHPQGSKTYFHIFFFNMCWMVYAIRTAFCSNKTLHRHFVEPIPPPSWWDPKSSKNIFLHLLDGFCDAQAFCRIHRNPLQIKPKKLKKHVHVYICWMVFVMRTAFCSNRLLHKYFVESTAPPSRCDVNILKKMYFRRM